MSLPLSKYISLLVFVISIHTAVQQGEFIYPGQPGSVISFPGGPFINLRNPIPVPVNSVRSRLKPQCAEVNDLFNSDAPCVNDQDYTDQVKNVVNRLLLQTPSVNEIVHDPMLKVILNDTLTPTPDADVSLRFGGPRESPACFSQEELIFPQRAKTPKNDWVFVVNQENVKQALRVERCIREGQPCSFGIASSREVETVCRQKFVYRRMLILNSNEISPEEVLMPSCCVCYVRQHNIDITSRAGNSSVTNEENDPQSTVQPTNIPNPSLQPTVTAAQPARQPVNMPQPSPSLPPNMNNHGSRHMHSPSIHFNHNRRVSHHRQPFF